MQPKINIYHFTSPYRSVNMYTTMHRYLLSFLQLQENLKTLPVIDVLHKQTGNSPRCHLNAGLLDTCIQFMHTCTRTCTQNVHTCPYMYTACEVHVWYHSFVYKVNEVENANHKTQTPELCSLCSVYTLNEDQPILSIYSQETKSQKFLNFDDFHTM